MKKKNKCCINWFKFWNKWISASFKENQENKIINNLQQKY